MKGTFYQVAFYLKVFNLWSTSSGVKREMVIILFTGKGWGQGHILIPVLSIISLFYFIMFVFSTKTISSGNNNTD